MRRLMAAFVSAITLTVLTACMSGVRPASVRLVLPELQLAPAAMGSNLTLAQRLTLVRVNDAGRLASGTPRTLDALLEIDDQTVQLAGFALGQRILMLTWNGKTLQSTRHALLPAEVDAARVLRDVQLVYWPVQAVRDALPSKWTIEDQVKDGMQTRVLTHAGEPQVEIKYAGVPRWNGRAELDNHLEGYLMTIDSQVQTDAVP